MKNIYIVVLFLLSFISIAQKKTETIDSNRLGKSRQISIILPPSYGFEKDKKYPVIYLLDGEYLMDPFNGSLQYGYYFDDLPEVILVGIHQAKNNDRIIDSKGDEEGLPTEKSGNFYEFIATEVIPFINNNYRTVPYKVIAGHDVTAGFLNFFLYKDNPIFDGYISFCPDLAYNMENRIEDRLKMSTKPISYFQVSSPTDEKSIYERVKLLDENLKTVINKNVSYKYLQLDGYSHYSMVPVAIPQALYHVFKGYQPINKEEYKELQNQTSGFVDYVTEKYKNINTIYGLDMKVRLIDFIAIQNLITKNGSSEELKNLEKIASKEYPKTMLASFIESSYYEKDRNYDKAIKAVEKGYSSREIGMFTKSFMLEKLEDLKRKRAGQ
jgi:predicted alpha/beta superfamily hydrolase